VTLEFVYTSEFDRLAQGLLTDDELRAVELQLLDNPRAGVVVAGTGGVRKLRITLPGRGKRGSARIIYLYVAADERVYFLLVYAKNVQSTLSEATKQRIQRIVAALKEG
jgi:hypothetical protein